MRGCGRLLVCWLTLVACTDTTGPGEQPTFEVPEIGLRLPKLNGWVIDESVGVEDAAKGGELFRLVRQSAVAGSPRIMVLVESVQLETTRLEAFLTENLRGMAVREKAGGIRILHVDQRPIRIGPRDAYRVRHEYTVGTAASQVAISQVSTLMVLDGRGVAITAAGRTELFHPLADSIERIVRGVRVSTDPPPAASRAVGEKRGAKAKTAPPTTAEPIDLGRLGGEN